MTKAAMDTNQGAAWAPSMSRTCGVCGASPARYPFPDQGAMCRACEERYIYDSPNPSWWEHYEIWESRRCDWCGKPGAKQTVCGGPVLCHKCEWEHRDECQECAAYFEHDQAMLRAWQRSRKHQIATGGDLRDASPWPVYAEPPTDDPLRR